MQSAIRFIENNMPTFKKAWYLLTSFIYVFFGKGPIYAVSIIIAVALTCLSYKYIERNTIGHSWLDNSSYEMLDENEENYIIKAVFRHIDSVQAEEGYSFCVFESTHIQTRNIEYFAKDTALPCLSIWDINTKPRNIHESLLGYDSLKNKTNFILFTRKESQAISEGKTEFWSEFRKQHPEVKGIIGLSRPGISSDHKTALIDIGFNFGWLFGNGSLYKLNKIDGVWYVEEIYYTWIS